MLSRKLHTLHVWWIEIMEGRAEFTAEGLRQYERMLAESVELAEAMEATPVALAGQQTATGHAGTMPRRSGPPIHIADNVLLFPVVARPRPEEGDAAS